LLNNLFICSSGEGIELLCCFLELYSQHQLEVFQILLKGRRDAQKFKGLALRIAVVARELELKRTYLKLLKRLRVALAPLVDQQISDKPNLKSTNSSFESILYHITPLCHDTLSSKLCDKLSEAFWSLKGELSKSGDSDASLREAVTMRREDIVRVEKQIDELLSPISQERFGDFHYWYERDMSLNRINVHTSIRQCLVKRCHLGARAMNVVGCDYLGRLLIVSFNQMPLAPSCITLGIDLYRDFSSVCLPQMLTPRYKHGMIQHGGYVYAVGGVGKGGKAYQCERLSLQTKKWEYFEEVPVAYKSPSLTVLSKHLYAMGNTGNATSQVILELCLVTLTWTLFVVSIASLSFHAPLLFRIPNHNSEFLLLMSNSIWSIDPATRLNRFFKHYNAQDIYKPNIYCQVISDKLFCAGTYQSLVTVELPSSLCLKQV